MAQPDTVIGESPFPVFTQSQPEEVIQVVQYLGAKLTRDWAFPRWKVNRYAKMGLISVEPGTRRGKYLDYHVRVSLPDKSKTLRWTVQALVAAKPKK